MLLLLTSSHGGCETVRTILDADPKWVIVGDEPSVEEAEAAGNAAMPDLILVAMDLGDGALVDVIERLQGQSPRSRIVVFSGTPDGVRQQELARDGRISRILWRDVDKPRLEGALELAARGMRAESAAVHRETSENAPRRKEGSLSINLTDRQREVAIWLRAGLQQPGIAKAMHRSLRTIEAIVRELKTVTGARTLAELIDKLRDLELGEPETGT